MSNQNKQIQQIIEEGEAMGWIVEKTSGQHYKWTHPEGGMFYCASTSANYRVYRNIRALMKHTKGNPRLLHQRSHHAQLSGRT